MPEPDSPRVLRPLDATEFFSRASIIYQRVVTALLVADLACPVKPDAHLTIGAALTDQGGTSLRSAEFVVYRRVWPDGDQPVRL